MLRRKPILLDLDEREAVGREFLVARRRRAQRRSRTALLQHRRRLVLDGREHGGRLAGNRVGWPHDDPRGACHWPRSIARGDRSDRRCGRCRATGSSTTPSACRGCRPAVAIDPVAPPRCSSGAPPTGFAKKNSGDAASRACGKRKPMQADALSDANSIRAWRFFGSRGRPKSPCVKLAPFQMQIQCTRDHHPAQAAAVGRRRAPLARQAASTASASRKKIQRGPRRPRATRANGSRHQCAGSESGASRPPRRDNRIIKRNRNGK